MCPDAQKQIASIVMTVKLNIDLLTIRKMLGEHIVSSLTSKGFKYLQNLCEFQCTREDVAEYKINTAKFTTTKDIHDDTINQLHLEHLFTQKNVILSLYCLKSDIVPKDALYIYPNYFLPWMDNTGAIDLSILINLMKPLQYESMRKTQSDDTHSFWSPHKLPSNHIAHKPYSSIYSKEFLAWNTTIHIHSENSQLVNKQTSFFPLSVSPDLYHMYYP